LWPELSGKTRTIFRSSKQRNRRTKEQIAKDAQREKAVKKRKTYRAQQDRLANDVGARKEAAEKLHAPVCSRLNHGDGLPLRPPFPATCSAIEDVYRPLNQSRIDHQRAMSAGDLLK